MTAAHDEPREVEGEVEPDLPFDRQGGGGEAPHSAPCGPVVRFEEQVGLALRAYRRTERLSQRALADVLGLTQSTVARLERSAGHVSLTTVLQALAAAGGGAVYVTFAAADAISVARSTDAGTTFTTPVILPGAGKLALGRHRGPRVAATRDAVIVAAIAGAGANALALHRHGGMAATRGWAGAAAVASLLLWTAAVGLGRGIAYW